MFSYCLNSSDFKNKYMELKPQYKYFCVTSNNLKERFYGIYWILVSSLDNLVCTQKSHSLHVF